MKPVRWISLGLCVSLFAAAGSLMAASTAGTASTPSASKPPASAASSPKAETEEDATLRAIGILVSRQLSAFQLTDAELRKVLAGVTQGVHHPEEVRDAQGQITQIQALARARMAAASDKQQKIGQAFIDKVAMLPGAQKLASGLVYIPIVEGSGKSPTATDQVKVNYTGKLTNGTVFDASAQHGGPATLSLNGIVPCWSQSLQMMKVGGKSRVVCPAALAYGDRGSPPTILPGSTLDFEIELLDVLPPAPTNPAVPRVMPPSSAAPGAPTPTPPHP